METERDLIYLHLPSSPTTIPVNTRLTSHDEITIPQVQSSPVQVPIPFPTRQPADAENGRTPTLVNHTRQQCTTSIPSTSTTLPEPDQSKPADTYRNEVEPRNAQQAPILAL
ncbi:uncharacterized protein N7496_009299 [Penicillium cataractarum]|uniref:Uncharacterized protein n=1 Tax=Penicillium cataractarum TaxID=2100454 RepID=A0A9W9RNP8_9EURO|nr:uncharacterized protein N7496_009299 [Penicillium cataractarum]KAJ5363586.1 hypothetical protein N7496_009299 [Penicillium cataractarum]